MTTPASSSAAAAASALGETGNNTSNNNDTDNNKINEEDLRQQLQSLTNDLKRREPLKTTYKHLLTDGVVTSRKPAFPSSSSNNNKDGSAKFYRRIGSRLRETVEQYALETQGKDPFDRIAARQPLDEEKMRAALSLREFKEHEQTPLLEATLAALAKQQRNSGSGGDAATRKRNLEGVALGLQSSKKPRKLLPVPKSPKQKTAADVLDQKREQARAQEEARQAQQKQEEDRKRREQEAQKSSGAGGGGGKKSQTTPQQALHKFYHPIFKLLWDMEFPYLGNTNPFRTVIDRDNCASIGAPDYFSIIDKPMNLTYIQQKVDSLAYHSLSEFFQDVDLMLQNAIKYNSDPSNPYRHAAEEMQKKYKRAAKRVVQTIQKKHGTKT